MKWDRVGGGENLQLRHSCSSYDTKGTHTMAHATLVGHRDVQSAVGAILGPYHLISALHLCSHDFQGSAKCLPEKQAS